MTPYGPIRERRRVPRLRSVLLILGGLSIAGLVWLYSLVSYHPPVVATGPPPTPQETRQAAQHIQEQVKEIQRKKAEGKPEHFQLRVTSRDANSLLAAQPARPPDAAPESEISEVRNLKISFDAGRVVVHGDVTYSGKMMYITVAGGLLPDGQGSVMFAPDEMLIGKLPMPTALRARVARRVEDAIRERITAMGVSVQSIEIANGQIVIQGTTGRTVLGH